MQQKRNGICALTKNRCLKLKEKKKKEAKLFYFEDLYSVQNIFHSKSRGNEKKRHKFYFDSSDMGSGGRPLRARLRIFFMYFLRSDLHTFNLIEIEKRVRNFTIAWRFFSSAARNRLLLCFGEFGVLVDDIFIPCTHLHRRYGVESSPVRFFFFFFCIRLWVPCRHTQSLHTSSIRLRAYHRIHSIQARCLI